jgi:DNA-binding SARP family transcriptional activator
LGPFEARVQGQPLAPLRTRRGYQLLALLALRAPREVERTWLVGQLWPDSDEPQALANLRNTLKDLRRALGPAAERLHSPSPRTLSLSLTGADIDVPAFDQAIARGDTASLEQAISLYPGPLLEGWGDEWIFPGRAAREQAWLEALETLAARSQAKGNRGRAERYLRQIIAVDFLRESAQRKLMEVLAAQGSYAAANEVYQRLRKQLHGKLNAEPDTETTALFQQIRAEARRRARISSGYRPQPATPAAASARDAGASVRAPSAGRTLFE